jgi:hypothetical protein
MAFKSINRRGATALLAAATVIALAPSAAVATWRVHNDADVTQITAPPGGTEDQTCANELRGQTGFALDPGVDPAVFVIPPIAFQAVTYDVYTKPAGAPNGGTIDDTDAGIVYNEPDGITSVPALFVKQFTTSPRTAVTPPQNLPDHGTNFYLFTIGNFSTPLPASIHSGDPVGIKPASGGSTFVTLTAVDCGPVPVRIDVRPGSSTNNVNPRQSTPLLPVLVYGSSTIDVRTIAAVHLQNASPKAVAANLRRPFDADGDGFLDRRYYFAPSATGIRCGQTTVALTGRTTSGLHFKGTDPIHTVC